MGGNLQGRGGWLLGALAIVVIAIAGYFILRDPAPQPEPETPPVATLPETPAAPETPEVAATPEADPAPDDVAPEAAPPLMPSFDVVRIKPDGGAVVAGRTEPSVPVAVMIDDLKTAETKADGEGNFVALFDMPPADVTRVMTLQATLPDGSLLISEESVIVEAVAPVEVAEVPEAEPAPGSGAAPEAVATPETDAAPGATPDTPGEPAPDTFPEAGGDAEAAAPADMPADTPRDTPSDTAPDTAPDAGGDAVAEAPADTPADTPSDTASGTAADAPDVAAAPETIEPAPAPDTAPEDMAALDPAPDADAPDAPGDPDSAAPDAPRVLLAGPEGITVLQDSAPDALVLSIDTISYDDGGEVALAGRGTASDKLRIYLDNLPVLGAEVGPDGQWRAPLPEVAPGVYTLRVDAVAADGSVTSRVETPFKREDPVVLEAAQAEAEAATGTGRRIASITVQKDDTLWAIARDRYGEGMLYVKVFEANRNQIRDPHWIYPGQVFTLPDDDTAPAGTK